MSVTTATAAPSRHPTFPGLPATIALSPSRASDFLTCPLLFRFRAIDRFPERPSAPAARGTLVHQVLEDLFDLPAADRTLESARKLLEPAWASLVEQEPDLNLVLLPDAQFPVVDQDDAPSPTVSQVAQWLTDAEPLLRTYFCLEDPTRLEPEAREMRVEVQLEDGPPLRGIIDRLDVAPGDLLRVVDYKTGRSPSPGYEQKAMFQMRFYALMLWRLRGILPKRLQLLYLGDGQVVHYDPTPEELIGFERMLRALWTTITAVAANGDWQPKESKLCGWCDHHALCPAKGGITPPLPTFIDLTADR
ncbi:MAG: PD-(D/E)XK nuclease family protein [Actinomycetes bacterium]